VSEPLASAVVRIAADDAPLKGNLARLSSLLHEIGDSIDRYVAEGEPTLVPWPERSEALTEVGPHALKQAVPRNIDVQEDK
jgi:hypothetical protein